MPSDEMEELLASTPTRQLSPEARRRIVDAVVAAEGDRRARWWSRGVPIWQTAAAVAVACVLTFAAARFHRAGATRQRPQYRPTVAPAESGRATASTFVRLDPAVFRRHRRPVYETNITQWQTIHTHWKGQPRP